MLSTVSAAYSVGIAPVVLHIDPIPIEGDTADRALIFFPSTGVAYSCIIASK
jgi:hypothetical protein